MRTAAGASSTARSHWVSSLMAGTAFANPNEEPVDLWTTKRVAHKAHRLNNRSSSNSDNTDEQNEKTVTHVAGQTCYRCRRLTTRGTIHAKPILQSCRLTRPQCWTMSPFSGARIATSSCCSLAGTLHLL